MDRQQTPPVTAPADAASDRAAPPLVQTKRAAFDDELRHVRQRRLAQGRPADDAAHTLTGLALSGGGIRSATFALGVLEALKERGVLRRLDYLSTVSGGGFIGAWLSANCVRARQRQAAIDSGQVPPAIAADSVRSAAYARAARDWLAPDADWDESVRHLRRYSNYLSPQLGFFSADTWSMATVWLRNTLLVQLTVILAIAAVLLLPRLLFELFVWWPQSGPVRWATVLLLVLAVAGIGGNLWRVARDRDVGPLDAQRWKRGLCCAAVCLGAAWWLAHVTGFDPFTDGAIDWRPALAMAALTVGAGFFLLPVGMRLLQPLLAVPARHLNYGQGWMQTLVVLPMLGTGFLLAAILWGQTVGTHAVTALQSPGGYGAIFATAIDYWPFPLTIAFVSMWLLSLCSRDRGWRAIVAACLAPVPAVASLYALLCAIMLLMHGWAMPPGPHSSWLAFIWAPSLVMYAFSLAVVALIGMMGRQSSEGVREWWARLGAWFLIYGMAWAAATLAAVIGPYGAALLADSGPWQSPSVLLGWLVTTLGGLMAGNAGAAGSGKGQRAARTRAGAWIDAAALFGPYVFLAGLLVGIATGLHLLLRALSGYRCCTTIGFDAQYWSSLSWPSIGLELQVLGAIVVLLLVLAARVDINIFNLNSFYRGRLTRCYLGAARFIAGERAPHRFTQFDDSDDLPLSALAGTLPAPDSPQAMAAAGPLHVINCALNLGGSSDLSLHTRHSASFTLTPYTAGSGYPAREADGTRRDLGYRPIAVYRDEKPPTLGQAIAISGAAASPNMGYHTSPVVAFFLTVFNLRLGWWFPNPRLTRTTSPSPWFGLRYLLKELFGGADERSNYLMLSDGGHFENLAAYELVQRRCRVVIVSDAEADPELHFGALGSLIRMCEVDFGARITLDTAPLIGDPQSPWSHARYAVGTIAYREADVPDGVFIYLKAAMTGKEDAAVLQYKASHPMFPHESTGDQFYGEDQFESYRRLGKDVALAAFDDDASHWPS